MPLPTQSPPPGAAAPKRIVWLADGPYVLSEPRESTACCVSWVKTAGGWTASVEQRASAMVSRIERPATRDEIDEWRKS